MPPLKTGSGAMYKIILWDFDGTLTNFKHAQKHAIKSMFERLELGPCDDAAVDRYDEINEKYWRLIEAGKYDKRTLLLQRFIEFFEELGLPTNAVEEFNDRYQVALGETTVYNDDSFTLLSDLRGRIRQYIVTNGTKRAQENKLANSGFDKIVDAAFISEETGFDKPSAGFYKYVFARIPSCERREILMVGDSLTSDMKGGYEQGMTCVWYNPAGDPLPADIKIDYDIRNLQEVREILRGSIDFSTKP